MGIFYDSSWGGHCVGRIDPDGRVYDSSWGGKCIGMVEPDGKVYDSDWGGNCIGRVENMCSLREGAALRLLCISSPFNSSHHYSRTNDNPNNHSSYDEPLNQNTSTDSVPTIPFLLAIAIVVIIILICDKFKYQTFLLIGIIASLIMFIYALVKKKRLDFSSPKKIIHGAIYAVAVFVITQVVSMILLLFLNVFGGYSGWQSALEEGEIYINIMAILFSIMAFSAEILTDQTSNDFDNDSFDTKKDEPSHNSNNTETTVSYWCDKCGQAGPYGDRCPKCGSSLKRYNVK